MTNISIREFIRRFDAGEFNYNNRSTQIDAGWYDWFCKDTSLAAKTQILGKRLKSIADSHMIDQDNMYVFFKNNCPMNGRLYDSFSICEMGTGDVLFWITPSNGHYAPAEEYGKPQVASKDSKFEHTTFKNWNEVKKWFNEE